MNLCVELISTALLLPLFVCLLLTLVAFMASLLVEFVLNPFHVIRLFLLLVAILSVIHAGQVNFFPFFWGW
jgi:hypothetical protein